MVELPKEHVVKFQSGLKLMRKVIQNVQTIRQRFASMDTGSSGKFSPRMMDTMKEVRGELNQWMAVGESAMKTLQQSIFQNDNYSQRLTQDFEKLRLAFTVERKQLEMEVSWVLI
jgi:hypothetical protein